MNSTLLTAFIGFASAVITSTVSHWFILSRLRREGAQRSKEVLLQRQLDSYVKLWSILKPTSRYCIDGCILSTSQGNHFLNPSSARSFCDSLTEFFFSQHGIFLSRKMRSCLFEARDLMNDHINGVIADQNGMVSISGKKAEKIRSKFVKIHIQARNDIGMDDLKFNKADLGVDEQ